MSQEIPFGTPVVFPEVRLTRDLSIGSALGTRYGWDCGIDGHLFALVERGPAQGCWQEILRCSECGLVEVSQRTGHLYGDEWSEWMKWQEPEP